MCEPCDFGSVILNTELSRRDLSINFIAPLELSYDSFPSLLIEREIRLCYNLIDEFCTLLLRKTIGRLIIRLSNCEFFNTPTAILHYALNFNMMLFRCKLKSIMFSFDLSCDKLSFDETINCELLIIRIFEAILNTLLLYLAIYFYF